MFAVLNLVLGIAAPFIPSIIGFFKDKQDQKFELERMKLSMEMAAKEHALRMTEMELKGDIEETKLLHQPEQSFGVQILDKAHGNLPMWSVVPVFWMFSFADFARTMVRINITYFAVGLWGLYKYSQLQLMQRVSDESFNWYEGVVKLWSQDDLGLVLLVLGYWFGQQTVKRYWPGSKT